MDLLARLYEDSKPKKVAQQQKEMPEELEQMHSNIVLNGFSFGDWNDGDTIQKREDAQVILKIVKHLGIKGEVLSISKKLEHDAIDIENSSEVGTERWQMQGRALSDYARKNLEKVFSAISKIG